MKKKLLFILCLAFAVSAFGQSRTVTNADLEKYRQKRIQAEREYNENYQRLGLPSPAEIQMRNEQSRRELSELSARLDRENLEREISVQRQTPVYVIQNVTINQRRSNFPFFYPPYRFFYFRPLPIRSINRNNQIQPIRPPQPIQPPL